MALWLLAGLLAVVAVLVLGQLLARQIALDATDYPVLHALGMTRRQLTGLIVARCTAIGAAGAVLAVAVAIALSPFTPIGVARTAEPHPGFAVDVPVLVIAAAGTIALVVLLALWPAWRTAGGGHGRTERRGRTRARSPLDRGRGQCPRRASGHAHGRRAHGPGTRARPGQRARADHLGGAVVGLAAMVAALVFGASLSHLLASPPLYGVTWDTEIWNNNGPGAVRAAEPVVRADPDVATAAFIQTGVDFRLGGQTFWGSPSRRSRGPSAPSMLTGRAPAGADEVALGANTAAQLGVRPGATLTGHAEHDGAPLVPVRMVGTAVLPPGGRQRSPRRRCDRHPAGPGPAGRRPGPLART